MVSNGYMLVLSAMKKVTPFVYFSLIWGLAEATFFFIVPDVLLSYIAIKNFKSAKIACIFATIGALIGGLIMYAWGQRNLESAETFLDKVPAISKEMLDDISLQVKDDRGLAIFKGPLQGQPYKAYAVYSGSDGIDYLSFILITIPARIIRFIITILLVNFLLNKILGKRKNVNKTLLLSCWWVIFYSAYFLLI